MIKIARRRRARTPNAPRETSRAVTTMRAFAGSAGTSRGGLATRRISEMSVASGVSFGTNALTPLASARSRMPSSSVNMTTAVSDAPLRRRVATSSPSQTRHAVIENEHVRIELADKA
jgi:hypothetical protein